MKARSASACDTLEEGRNRLDSATGGPEPSEDSGQARLAIGPSTALGPISTTRSTFKRASVSIPGPKATGWRVCRRQYFPSGSSPDSTTRPVTLLTSVKDGGAISSLSQTDSSSSSMGSTRALWKACSVRRRLTRMSWARKRSEMAATNSSGPLTTWWAPL